jgi:hypothetical protein
MAKQASNTMDIAVQPPTQATVGAILYPPVVVSSDSSTQISYLDVEATDIHGQVYAVLSGETSKSRAPMDDNQSSSGSRATEYSAFPDLSIGYPGTYVLHFSAVLTDYTNPDEPVAMIVDSVTTRPISVYEETVTMTKPCTVPLTPNAQKIMALVSTDKTLCVVQHPRRRSN